MVFQTIFNLKIIKRSLCFLAFTFLFSCKTDLNTTSDPLPSWNDSESKSSILNFVESVTNENDAFYVPVKDRIAVFDNDGTLWTERPLPPQVYFILENAKEEGLEVNLANMSKQDVVELAVQTQTGMTEDEYRTSVTNWIATAKHPEKKRLFKDLKFQPMTELRNLLKENGFTIFIVSGGSRDFMRCFSNEIYGVPEYRTIGSTFKTSWNDSLKVIERNSKLELIDDGKGKAVGVYNYIGKKPIFIAGNSDGDMAMMEYASTQKNIHFLMLWLGIMILTENIITIAILG